MSSSRPILRVAHYRRKYARFLMGGFLAAAVVARAAPILAQGCDPVQTGGLLGWTVLAPLPSGRSGATGVMIGNRIYVTHGSDISGPIGTTLIYNRALNSWTSGAASVNPRGSLAGVCVEGANGQGQVLAIGGALAGGGAVSTVEMYNPANNTWVTRAPMPTPRSGLAVVLVPGFGVAGGGRGTVYAIGGAAGGGQPVAANEAYDVELNQWVGMAPMPMPTAGRPAAVFSPDTGLVYVIGGQNLGGFAANVWIYDPQANLWTAGAAMPTPRQDLIAGICGVMIYAAGGFDFTGPLATNEVYNPFLNTWAGATAMPTAASSSASQAISSGLEMYSIGNAIGTADVRAINEVFTCGTPFCFGAISCSDGDPCTLDTCNYATGACDSQPSNPGPIGDTLSATHNRATGVTTMSWTAYVCSVATISNTYRGTIPPSLLGSRGSTAPYDHSCFESADTGGNGATVSTDGVSPAVGTGFYYLVSAESTLGESPLGSRSDGTSIFVNVPCPSPPP